MEVGLRFYAGFIVLADVSLSPNGIVLLPPELDLSPHRSRTDGVLRQFLLQAFPHALCRVSLLGRRLPVLRQHLVDKQHDLTEQS